jgi:hypothetical protein
VRTEPPQIANLSNRRAGLRFRASIRRVIFGRRLRAADKQVNFGGFKADDADIKIKVKL